MLESYFTLGAPMSAVPFGATGERANSVCCAHVAIARSKISDVRTRETDLRPKMSERPHIDVVDIHHRFRPGADVLAGWRFLHW